MTARIEQQREAAGWRQRDGESMQHAGLGGLSHIMGRERDRRWRESRRGEEISAGGEKDDGDLWEWDVGDDDGNDEGCGAAVLNMKSMSMVGETGVRCV